jgi:hypothetical protein
MERDTRGGIPIWCGDCEQNERSMDKSPIAMLARPGDHGPGSPPVIHDVKVRREDRASLSAVFYGANDMPEPERLRVLDRGRQLTRTAAEVAVLRCRVCKRPPREVSAANLWKRYQQDGEPLFFPEPARPERPVFQADALSWLILKRLMADRPSIIRPRPGQDFVWVEPPAGSSLPPLPGEPGYAEWLGENRLAAERHLGAVAGLAAAPDWVNGHLSDRAEDRLLS